METVDLLSVGTIQSEFDEIKKYLCTDPEHVKLRGYHITTLTRESAEKIQSGSGLLCLKHAVNYSFLGEFLRKHGYAFSFEKNMVLFRGQVICSNEDAQSSGTIANHVWRRLFGDDQGLNFFSFVPNQLAIGFYSSISLYPEIFNDLSKLVHNRGEATALLNDWQQCTRRYVIVADFPLTNVDKMSCPETPGIEGLYRLIEHRYESKEPLDGDMIFMKAGVDVAHQDICLVSEI